MRVRYTAPAARSLDSILDGIAERSPLGARHVQTRIQALVALLADYPLLGQITRRRGTRRIVVSLYPYLIFYRATGEEIIIDAVRHAARRPRA